MTRFFEIAYSIVLLASLGLSTWTTLQDTAGMDAFGIVSVSLLSSAGIAAFPCMVLFTVQILLKVGLWVRGRMRKAGQ